MIRSLYSSISGLRNHQVSMDVTANNISNVNTIGFKAGRVTFEESMAQLLKGASRPPGNAGGTNPMQVGLGMSIGSVDTLLVQGNLQSTGQITDLAIEGRGYFCYSNGEALAYSRNGAIQFDGGGKMVSPTNGFALQGMMADATGKFPVGTKVGDIRIPYGEKSPAHASTEIKYACNLDSDSEGLGTIIHTNSYLAVATGDEATPADSDLLTALFDENGNSLGIKPGDRLFLSCVDGNSASTTALSSEFVVTETSTYQDLADAMEQFLSSNITNGLNVETTVDNQTGRMQVDMSAIAPGQAIINNLTIRSNRPGSNSYVSNLFSWGTSITGSATNHNSVGAARAPAARTDLLVNLFDASGKTLGLEDDNSLADIISINGSIGGMPITTRNVTFSSAGASATTLNDLLLSIQTAFNLPDTDGTQYNNTSVDVNSLVTGDKRIPAGAIVIRGQREEAFALSNVSITATNQDNDSTAPTRFTSNMIMTEVQQARDTGVHSTSITVYDESGDSHVLTTTFTHSGEPGEWLWEISTNGGEQILGGNRGRIYFGQDGSPSAFTFDDANTMFRFNPMNGSKEVSVSLDVGGPGSFQGITQFRASTTTAAREQDGYPMGKLSEISINEFGEISGLYTNGVNKTIARILVAEFNNPAGLSKSGDSMYQFSNNSGEGVLLQPGVGSTSKIKPGALEMSNVELATEFTNLITTQRGFQANARVITTSDEMLQELVQLVR
ncbi:MAG: flagellar hook-basal body complex protein [Chitinivibrionales bacterium]|nr:flagellar hook-basal body complex protein [Chitinivibrionales bacterium]